MCIRDSGGAMTALAGQSADGLIAHAFTTRRYLEEVTLPALCLLYTSDAADERSSVDLGGRRILKKKNGSDRQPADSITAQRQEEHNHQASTETYDVTNKAK